MSSSVFHIPIDLNAAIGKSQNGHGFTLVCLNNKTGHEPGKEAERGPQGDQEMSSKFLKDKEIEERGRMEDTSIHTRRYKFT
jgi:hypothetical protein